MYIYTPHAKKERPRLPQSHSVPPHTTGRIMQDVSASDFEAYINFRILDTIAYPGTPVPSLVVGLHGSVMRCMAGTYKKFLQTKKEQAAQWAIDMSDGVHAVTQAVTRLTQQEKQLKGSQFGDLNLVCACRGSLLI